ncbi:Calx-beta domain-containing protein, partial [Thioalkalivibrio sp. HK1]|uniref:Calx-beta domain-containing protein n=1 Tax=Thioalkalivibrio sp. HK1 TaxID=1469245 RepID=UPI0012DBCB1B
MATIRVHAVEAGLDIENEKVRIIITDIDGDPISVDPRTTARFDQYSYPPTFTVEEGKKFKIRIKLSGPPIATRDRGRIEFSPSQDVNFDGLDDNRRLFFRHRADQDEYWDHYQTVTITVNSDDDLVDTAIPIEIEARRDNEWESGQQPDPVVFWIRQLDSDSGLTFYEAQSGSQVYDASNPLQIEEGGRKTVYVQTSENPRPRADINIRADEGITADRSRISVTHSNYRNRHSVTLTAAVDANDTDESKKVVFSTPAPSSTDNSDLNVGYGFRITAELPVIVREPTSGGNEHRPVPNFVAPLTIEEGKVVNIGFKYPSTGNSNFIFARVTDANRIKIARATGPNDIGSSGDLPNESQITISGGSTTPLRGYHYIKIHAVDNDQVETGASATLEFSDNGDAWAPSNFIDDIQIRIREDDTRALAFSPAASKLGGFKRLGTLGGDNRDRPLVLEEGAAGTLKVKLTSKPTGRVTVSGKSLPSFIGLSPSTLEFTATDWNQEKTFSISAAHDVNHVNDNIPLTFNALGGGYVNVEGIARIDVQDNDTPGITVTPSTLTIDEGGAGSFKIALATRPDRDVGFSIDVPGSAATAITIDGNSRRGGTQSDLIIEPDDWSRGHSVRILSTDDDEVEDRSFDITVTTTFGSGYSDLQGNRFSEKVTVNVKDNEEFGFVIDGDRSASLTEGDALSYKIRLSKKPTETGSQVTVTHRPFGTRFQNVEMTPAQLIFTDTNWNVAQTLLIRAEDDNDSLDEIGGFIIGADDSGHDGGGYDLASATLSLRVADDDAPHLVFGPLFPRIQEGGVGRVRLRLGNAPTADVMVAVHAGDDSLSLVSPTRVHENRNERVLTFTAQNWETTQSVYLSAKHDEDGIDGRSEVVAYVVDTSAYNIVGSRRKSVLVHDDDTPGFVIDPKTLTIDEGRSASFDIKLVAKPTFSSSGGNAGSDVVVDLYHPDPDLVVDKSSLRFTASNWNQNQRVSVSARNDLDFHDESISLTLTSQGGDYAGVGDSMNIAVKDDEIASIVIDRQSLSLLEGAAVAIVVKLSHEPSGDVVLNLEQPRLSWITVDGDAKRSGLQSTLTFTRTNWNQGRRIRIIAAKDENANDETGTLRFTATGGSYEGVVANLSVRVSDPDTNDLLITGLENPTYVEGQSYSLGVRLKSRPTGQVSVSVAADDDILVFTPSSLTFTPTNWKKVQSIGLSVLEDDDALVNRPVITFTATGGGYDGMSKQLTTTVKDNDVKRVIVSPRAVSIVEGGSAIIGVRLSESPQTQRIVVFSLDITSTSAGYAGSYVNIVPNSGMTFTRDNWNVEQTRRVELSDDDNAKNETIVVRFGLPLGTGGGYQSDEVTITAVDEDTQGLMISPTGDITVEEGNSLPVDIALRAQPVSDMEVRLTPPLSQAHLSIAPLTLTFTRDNWSASQRVTLSAPLDLNSVSERFEIPMSVHDKRTGAIDIRFGKPSLSVDVQDRDQDPSKPIPGIVMLDTLKITENINTSVSVQLANRPSGRVNVVITPSEEGAAFLRLGPILTIPHSIVPTKTSHTLSFDQDNWNRSQSFLLGSVRDYDAVDRKAQLVAVASGSGYDAVHRMTVSEQDPDVAKLLPDSTNISLGEGGETPLKVRLATIPFKGSVTVNAVVAASSGITLDRSSLTFTSNNWNTPQVINLSAAEDSDDNHGQFVLTLRSTGADYQGLSASVLVDISDNDRPELMLDYTNDGLFSGISLPEGGSGTLRVKLRERPSALVGVDLRTVLYLFGDSKRPEYRRVNPTGIQMDKTFLAFTPSDWDTWQSVGFSSPQDNDYWVETGKVVMTYGIRPRQDVLEVPIVVIEDDASGPMIAGFPETIDEGQTLTFTVKLDAKPSYPNGGTRYPWYPSQNYYEVEFRSSNPLALNGVFNDRSRLINYWRYSFNSRNWNVPQTVTITAPEDDNAVSEEVVIHSKSVGLDRRYYKHPTINKTSTIKVIDNDAPRLITDRDGVQGYLVIDEGGSNRFRIRLSAEPVEPVRVDIVLPDDGELSADPNSVAFNSSNWRQWQTVTLTNTPDSDNYTEYRDVRLVAHGGQYSKIETRVALELTDKDTPMIDTDPEEMVLIEEGGSASFNVRLKTRVFSTSDPVRVALSLPADSDLTLDSDPSTAGDQNELVFTDRNWDRWQTVSLNAATDDNTVNDIVTISMVANGGSYVDVKNTMKVTIADAERSPAIVLTSELIRIDEGGNASFDISLGSKPTADVVLTFPTPINSDLTIDGDDSVIGHQSALRFQPANWYVPRKVVVDAAQDDDLIGENETIDITAAGGNYDDMEIGITLSIVDDDRASLVYEPDPLTIVGRKGSSANFRARLSHRPIGEVTATLQVLDNAAISLDDDEHRFDATNWDRWWTINVSVSDNRSGNRKFKMRLSTTGGYYDELTSDIDVLVSDSGNDALIVSNAPEEIDEGERIDFTVKLATAPRNRAEVKLVLNDPSNSGALRLDPATSIFTALDWDQPKTITLVALPDDDDEDKSLVVTLDASSINTANYNASYRLDIDIEDDDSKGLVLNPATVTIHEGKTQSVDISLATKPEGNVRVAFPFVLSGHTFDNHLIAPLNAARQPVPAVHLDYTPENWNRPQTVFFKHADDDNWYSITNHLITITASGGGYDGLTGSLRYDTVDNDRADIRFQDIPLTMDEGETATFKVRLDNDPFSVFRVGEFQEVSITSSHPALLSVDKSTISVDRTTWVDVTLTAHDDDVFLSREVELLFELNDNHLVDVVHLVSIVDDDASRLVIDDTQVTVDEGGSSDFTVKLGNRPFGYVDLRMVKSGSPDMTFDADLLKTGNQSTLRFTETNWNAARTVRVSAASDGDAADDIATISVSARGEFPRDGYDDQSAQVNIRIDDDETAAVIFDPRRTKINEGGSASLDISLATKPTATVKVLFLRSTNLDVKVDTTPALASIGSSLTFSPDKWNQPQTIRVFASDDDDTINDHAFIPVRATGGDYESLTFSHPVQITDDDTADIIFSDFPDSISESASAHTFGLRLIRRPTSDVTVTLAYSDTTDSALIGFDKTSFVFTSANWDSVQNGILTPVDNDEMSGDMDVELAFTPVGGGFSGDQNKRTISIIDDDQAGVEFEGVPVSVKEGNSATIKARLATRPYLENEVSVTFQQPDNTDVRIGSDRSAALVLEFTRGDWNTWQNIDLTAAADDDAFSESAIVSWSAAGGEYGDSTKNIAAITGKVDVNVLEDLPETTQRSLVFEDVPVILDESASETFKIRLGTLPNGNVRVTLTQPDNVDIRADTDATATGHQTTLDFTPADWDTAKTITVFAAADYDADDDSGVVAFNASGGGYDDIAAQVKVSVLDDDRAPALVFEDLPLTIDEGASGAFKVYLSTRPSEVVSLNITRAPPSNSDITLDTDTATEGNQKTLSFTSSNWYIAQSVTISAAQDNDALNDSQIFNINASGGNYAGVSGQASVVVLDDETPALVFDPTSLTIDEGDRGNIGVKLSTNPISTVTVTFTQPTNEDITADADTSTSGNQTSLTFGPSDWSVAKTIVVTAAIDDATGHDTGTIPFTASGGGYENVSGSVSITVRDGDYSIVKIDPRLADFFEGTSFVHDVWLPSRPSDDVVINFYSDNPDVTIDTDSSEAGNQTTLEFTIANYNTKRKITLRAADDEDDKDDRAKMTISGSGGGYDRVVVNTLENRHPDTNHIPVTVRDDDTDRLEYRNFPHSLPEGTSATFNIRLKSEPPNDISINMDHNQEAIDKERLGLGDVVDLTFTPNNWDEWQNLTVTSQDNSWHWFLSDRNDSINIDFTIKNSNYHDTKKIEFIDDEEVRLLFDPNPTRVLEGNNLVLRVKANAPPNTSIIHGQSWNVTFSQPSNTDLTIDTDTVAGGNQTTMVLDSTGQRAWNQWQPIMIRAAQDADSSSEKVDIDYEMRVNHIDTTYRFNLKHEATIIDDESLEFVLEDTPLALDEGTTGYFGIKLGGQPTANVTVNLEQPSNTDVTADTDTKTTGNQTSLTFTSDDWDTSQRVAVTASRDNDAEDENAAISLSATGGGYDDASATVNVAVHDTYNNQALVIDKETVSLSEGETATFSVRLLVATSVDLKVLISDSNNSDISLDKSELAFTVDNWNQAQIITVSAAHDPGIVDDQATFNLTVDDDDGLYDSVTGGVTVKVIDDDKPHILLDPSKPVIPENGSITAKIKLGIAPTANVTLTLVPEAGSDLTLDTDDDQIGNQSTLAFTTANWNVERDIVLKAAHDDDSTNDTVKINVYASGGDYEGVLVDLVKGLTYITARIQDDDFFFAFQGLPNRLREGQSATLRYKLSSNFNNSHPFGGGYQQKVWLEIIDSNLLRRTGVDVYSYVKVNNTLLEEDEESLDKPKSTIYKGLPDMTRENYNQWQEVTITAVDNDRLWFRSTPFSVKINFIPDRPFFATGGTFGSQTLTIVDDESADIVFQPATATVVEGGSLAVDVKLSVPPPRVLRTPPSNDLSKYINYDWTVTLGAPDDSDLSVDKKTLTFTSSGNTQWDQWQRVNLSAAEDADGIDDAVLLSARATARHDVRATGRAADYVLNDGLSVTIDDEDDAILSIIELGGVPVSVDEGASEKFTVKLKSQPAQSRTLTFDQPDNQDVTVDIDPDTSGNQTTLTFTTTDWQTAQEVTVAAGEDDDAIDETASIAFTLTGSDGDTTSAIPVDVDDNDTAGLVFGDFPESVGEGETATFKVKLSTVPSSTVDVAIASGNTNDLTVDKTTLAFTSSNWDAWQNVTLTAVDDNEAYGPDGIDLVFTPAGYGEAQTKTVNVVQDDSVGVIITRTPLSVPEGATRSFNVRLRSEPTSYGRNPLFSNNASIVFSKLGNSETRFNIGTGNSHTLTFNQSNWNQDQQVAIAAASNSVDGHAQVEIAYTTSGHEYGDSQSIPPFSSLTGRVGLILVDRGQTPDLDIEDFPALVNEGGSQTFMVSLTTAPGTPTDAGETVTVTFSSNESDVTIDSDLDLTGDQNTLVFTAADWHRAKTVTIKAAEDDDTEHESATVSVAVDGSLASSPWDDVSASKRLTVKDNDITIGLVFEDTPVSVEEGGTKKFKIKLSSPPTSAVSIRLFQPANTDVTLSTANSQTGAQFVALAFATN